MRTLSLVGLSLVVAVAAGGCKRNTEAQRLVGLVIERAGGPAALAQIKATMMVGRTVATKPVALAWVVDASRKRALSGTASGDRLRLDIVEAGRVRRLALSCAGGQQEKKVLGQPAELLATELSELEPLRLLARLKDTRLRWAKVGSLPVGQRAVAFELASGLPAVAIMDSRRHLLLEVRYGRGLTRRTHSASHPLTRIHFARWRHYSVLLPTEPPKHAGGVFYPSEMVWQKTETARPLKVRWERVGFAYRRGLSKLAWMEAQAHQCRFVQAPFEHLRRQIWQPRVLAAPRAPAGVTSSELPGFLSSVVERVGGAEALDESRSLRWRGHIPERPGHEVFRELYDLEARQVCREPKGAMSVSVAGGKYRLQASWRSHSIQRDADDELGVDASTELVHGDPSRLLRRLASPAAKPRLAPEAKVRAGQVAVDITLANKTVVTLVFDVRSRLLVEYRGRYGYLGDDGKKKTLRTISFDDWTITSTGAVYPFRWRYQALRPKSRDAVVVVLDELEFAPKAEKADLGRKLCVSKARCRWP